MNGSSPEALLRHRDHCLELAATAPSLEVQLRFRNIAQLYEREIELTRNASRCLFESRALIAEVEKRVPPGARPA
jgi:hypothetical protein